MNKLTKVSTVMLTMLLINGSVAGCASLGDLITPEYLPEQPKHITEVREERINDPDSSFGEVPRPLGYEYTPDPEVREIDGVKYLMFAPTEADQLDTFVETNTEMAIKLADTVLEREKQITQLEELGILEEERAELLRRELNRVYRQSWLDGLMMRGLLVILSIGVLVK